MPKTSSKKRCPWVNLNKPEDVLYHDKEWGRPLHDDQQLFEFLILEGAQAGLSWQTILKKRANYRKHFANFNPKKVAAFTPAKIERLMQEPGIVRNRLKITSAISNAKAFLKTQQEFGSFANYIWGFVNHQPIDNAFTSVKQYPAKTALSDKIAKDLKKRGFRFVGSTIIYAYMQAIGMVNDHMQDCFVRKKKVITG